MRLQLLIPMLIVRAALAWAATSGAPDNWVSAPQGAAADKTKASVALQFRREVILSAKPRAFPVRVSADQRFVLYVNAQRVAQGPARGDLTSWRYETLDLAPYLKRGLNIVAAEVWNDAKVAPAAQISSGITAFSITASDDAQAKLIDSGPDWSVRVDESRTTSAGMPQLIKQVGPTYYVAGPPETIDASLQVQDWTGPKSVGGDWVAATPALTGPAPWQLVADALPQMHRDKVASGKVVRTSGIAPGAFPRGHVTIPAYSEAAVLIDAGRVLAAYPVLRTSKGAGAEVKVTYTEALYDPATRNAGPNGARARFADRAHVGDGLVLGLTDTFKPDGGEDRQFHPFWWRTWRFVEIKVKTAALPLVLEGFDTYETGYPFEQRGRFVSDDPQLNEIWRVGWRTGLLDAHETYMDSAYWEQLQYVGDTRIQMLLSYDVAGDSRLAVQALDAFDRSRQLRGVPQAAWPENTENLIPPFALLWVGALHDYWMRQPDTAVVTRSLPGVRAVLDWYAPYVRETGLVGPAPGWPFIDWTPQLNGMGQRNGRGPDSCVITLMYYGALREAADLEGSLGAADLRTQDLSQAERVKRGLESACWDAARGLYADTPAKAEFSQHANALAVIYDVVPTEQQAAVLEKLLSPSGGIDAPEGVIGTTYYFSFYLAQALDHAGMADRYLSLLQTWRRLLVQNFTTWPEQPDPSRSDSHAWSAHPTSGLLTYVAGIQPSAPGFATVRVAPHLGPLKKLDAAVVHPRGLIETQYTLRNDHLNAVVTLPPGLTGEFAWNGRSRPLHGGVNQIAIVTHPSPEHR